MGGVRQPRDMTQPGVSGRVLMVLLSHREVRLFTPGVTEGGRANLPCTVGIIWAFAEMQLMYIAFQKELIQPS